MGIESRLCAALTITYQRVRRWGWVELNFFASNQLHMYDHTFKQSKAQTKQKTPKPKKKCKYYRAKGKSEGRIEEGESKSYARFRCKK